MSELTEQEGMVPLGAVLHALESIAPPALAADWDNVGLLVEPPARGDIPPLIRTVYLTIDLTPAVLDEALAAGAKLIVAYHPILFSGIKRLTTASRIAHVVMRAVQHGVFVYSPHTALDATDGGVNDWLVEALPVGKRRPIEPSKPSGDEPTTTGMGRFARLTKPMPVNDCVTAVKKHLDLDRVRLAACDRHRAGEAVTSVAVCAGAGGGVLAAERQADLWLTGEMRHHDVLAANARGVSVILCEHTNTERGYLPTLAARLAEEVSAAAENYRLEIGIAAADRDPLTVV